MARRYFADNLPRLAPPWLRRTNGGKLLRAFGAVIDSMVDTGSEGVKARFPREIMPDALAVIGKERRIRRGPAEPAASYARRLQIWLDSHRTRGGVYALIGQLNAYFLDIIPGTQVDVVYHSGTRRSFEIGDTYEVERDSITWDADGTDDWSQYWIFFSNIGDYVVTEDGDVLVNEDGDTIIASSSAATVQEIFEAIPREWSAAHILRVTIVVLAAGTRLWGYPPAPPPTWDSWDDDGTTWGSTTPDIFIIEFA